MRALSIVGTVLVYVFMLIVSVCSDAIIAIAEVGRFLTVPVAGLVNSIRNRGWIKRAAPESMRMKSVDYDAIMIAIAADIDSFIPPKDDGTIILKRRFNSTGYGKVKDDCDLCHGEKRMHMGNFERAGKFYHFYAGCPVCEHDPNLQIQEEPIESETMESRIKFWRALAFTILCAIPVWAALMGLFVYFRG